jgi:hypothetical protein
MKTTLDLPDPLLRKAKALAAQQGRTLRDLVAEAIGEKLKGAVSGGKADEGRRGAWDRWKARLDQLDNGSWFNPEGIADEAFFQSLDEARREATGDQRTSRWRSASEQGDRAAFDRVVAKVPAVPPDPWDRWEEK